MSITVYIVSAILVFIFSGLLAMAGIGAAFLFVPLFYYLGVPLAEATPTALLLNVVSLMFAAFNYWRGKLINWRVGLPVLIAAVILSPLGARLTPYVDKNILLSLFAAFLAFAGFMMLFGKLKARENPSAAQRRSAREPASGRWRQFHLARPELDWIGRQIRCRDNLCRGCIFLAFMFSRTCHDGRA